MTAASISRRQRDALYHLVLDRLSGIGDIELALASGDPATADRLAREYTDELLLVCDGLGWGGGPGTDRIDLDVPCERLRRLFSRWQEQTAAEREALAATRDEGRQLEERNELVTEACSTVLSRLTND